MVSREQPVTSSTGSFDSGGVPDSGQDEKGKVVPGETSSPWMDRCQRQIMECVWEPTAHRFYALGQLHAFNPTLKNLCLLPSLRLQPDQPQVLAEASTFWQSYRGCWPELSPRSPQCAVSVLITTFNRPKILANAISSVLEQTYQDFEILVINDGGDPAAEETVSQFHDRRLRYLCLPNSGQAAAFNYGIQQAVGEYLAFLDDDDVFAPDHLRTSLLALSRPGVDMVYGRVQVVQGFYRPDGHFIAIHQPRIAGEAYTRRRAISRCIFSTLGTVVRRQLLQQSGLFDESLPWGREWDLWLRCCEFTEPYFTNHVSGEYRRSGDNMTNQWYRGLFYEYHLLHLFHRTGRGSLILYTASLYASDHADREYWRDIFLHYPSVLDADSLAQFWHHLSSAPHPPDPGVLGKLLCDNPLATLKLIQRRVIPPNRVLASGGIQFFKALRQSWPELRYRFMNASPVGWIGSPQSPPVPVYGDSPRKRGQGPMVAWKSAREKIGKPQP
ncbi:MAG: glycosyltransferase [Candidatus Latescibacteria bacterium]|nr:glycosyltransferase [Candidatus Latescibacterota bacterium]